MSGQDVHPWFASTTGLTVTSHNGSATGEVKTGSLAAFRRARAAGYRWMQVDVVPVGGDLVSHHAIFGRAFWSRWKSVEEVRQKMAQTVTLRELLTDPELADVCWNIEMKSKKGLPALLDILRERAQTRDADRPPVLISSPWRPSVLKAVNAGFGDVALAAPIVHGGVFGIRFLGRRRARVGGRPYDCEQRFYRFVRARRHRGNHPLQQAWTIRNRRTYYRLGDEGGHPIVASERLGLPSPDVEASPAKTRAPSPREVPDVDVLALGGGGWRGAFGGIGAVMYFDARARWEGVGELVGISGGSFAVAVLSKAPTSSPRPAGPDHRGSTDAPAPVLKGLLDELEATGRNVGGIAWMAFALVVGVIALFVFGMVMSWSHRVFWGTVATLVMALATSFLVRLFVSLRWGAILGHAFGDDRMRVAAGAGRRYRVGATGLNDGNLYAFTSDPEGDRQRWENDRGLATPLGGWRLAEIVHRATSLPGLVQVGWHKLYLCGHEPPDQHTSTCDWVRDQLVDGGISGIFGRGLVTERTSDRTSDRIRDPRHPPPPLLVVVDAGRRLRVNTGRTVKDLALQIAQWSSALVLLVRWLTVGQEAAYRAELKRVKDDNESDGYRYRLVRLAEEEVVSGGRQPGDSPRRHQDLNRLMLLRDRVHTFSLVKASRAHSNRGIAVAVAACALEFEEEPDIPALLGRVGRDLGREGELAELWQAIPLLGEPSAHAPVQERELRPAQVLSV